MYCNKISFWCIFGKMEIYLKQGDCSFVICLVDIGDN